MRASRPRRRLLHAAVLPAVLLALPAATPLAAGAGELDPSFGSGGKLVLDATDAGAVAVRADGKVAVAGGGGSGFSVALLNADGTLDTAFGGDGKVEVVVSSTNDFATAVAFDSAGRIVVGGNAQADFAVARLNADGSLDATFAGDGAQLVPIAPGGFDVAQALAIDAGGRILVGGSSDLGSGGFSDFAVVRLTATGALDTGFGGDGIVTTGFGGFGESVHALAVQPDGRVVAAGPAFIATNDFGVARYLEDGSLDTSFGGDGKATVDFGSDETAWGVGVTSAGGVVVGGYSGPCCTDDFVAARLLPDGTLDPAFAGDGRSDRIDLGGRDLAFDLAVDGDDRVLLVGSREAAGDFDWGIVRLAPDGSRDAGFGSGGVLASPFATGFARAFGVAVQADGRFVVAGPAQEGGADGAGVARFLPAAANAAPAASFGVTPASGTTATTFSFDGTASSDPDGDPLTHAWAFGDGATATGATATHAYAAPGTYTASLTVADGRGGTSSSSRTVEVGAPAPTPTPAPAPAHAPADGSPTAGSEVMPVAPVGPARRVELAIRKQGRGSGVVRSEPGAIACGTKCSGTFDLGAKVTLRAIPGAASTFRGWSGGCVGARPTCVVTLDRVRTVLARFEARRSGDPYTLAVEPRRGGVVASWEWGIDGAPLDCGSACVNRFRRGSSVRLVAVAHDGFDFAGWAGACAGQGPWCSLVLSSSRSTAARFVPSPVLLTVSTSGSGAVATWEWGLDGRPIDCGSLCSTRFLEGSRVRLVAVPAPGHDFVGWAGACAGQGPWCTLTMSAARTTHAGFAIRPGTSG